MRGALTEDGEKILADAVIVATGGKSYPATGSTGDGYQLARQAGHRVTPLRPSLIPLVCKEKYCRDMMGLSLKNVTLRVVDTQSGKEVFSELGEMLFTHFGVSGPLVLSASCHMRAGQKRLAGTLPAVHRLEARPQHPAAGRPHPARL